MVVKVFTGKGALARLHGKKVLSNKSLSSRVRALSGLEGTRTMENETLYGSTALSGGTAVINYLDALNALENDTLHRVRLWIDYITTATNIVRIIFFQDNQATATEAVTADILQAELVRSGYNNGIHPFSAKMNNKNLDGKPRFRILKDMYFSSVAGEFTSKLAKIVDIPLHNKKSSELVDYGLYVLSDVNGMTINIRASYDFTDLEL